MFKIFVSLLSGQASYDLIRKLSTLQQHTKCYSHRLLQMKLIMEFSWASENRSLKIIFVCFEARIYLMRPTIDLFHKLIPVIWRPSRFG